MDLSQIRKLAGLPSQSIDLYQEVGTFYTQPSSVVDAVIDLTANFLEMLKDISLKAYYQSMCNQVTANNGIWLHDSNDLKVFVPSNWIGYSKVLNCCNDPLVDIDTDSEYIKYASTGTFFFILSYDQVFVLFISQKYLYKPHFAVDCCGLGAEKHLVDQFPVIRIVLKDYIEKADSKSAYSGEFLSHFKITVTDLDVLLSDLGVQGLLQIQDKMNIFPNHDINQILRNWHVFSGFADQSSFKVGNINMSIINPKTMKFETVEYAQDQMILKFTDPLYVCSFGTPMDILLVWQYIIQRMSVLLDYEYDPDDIMSHIIECVYCYLKTGKPKLLNHK